MKRCFLVLVCVFLTLSGLFADAKSVTQKATADLIEQFYKKTEPSAFKLAIAVMPVMVPEDLKKSGADEAIAAFIKEKISTSSAFVLVDRENMDKLLSEIELSLSGLVDPEKAVEAGKLVGADLFLRCSLVSLGESYSLAMELIETQTGKITAAVSREIATPDILADTQEYLKSSFQSQFGLTLFDRSGLTISTTPYWYRDNSTDAMNSSPIYAIMNEVGVSYKLLPWLEVNAGYLVMIYPQFILNSSGKVVSPLSATNEETTRYTEFNGSGINLGTAFLFTPTPRFNILLAINSFMLLQNQLKHTFMDFKCYDITDTGTVDIINRDIIVEGTMFGIPLGMSCGLKAEFLISRRLSIGLESGYLYMKDYIPDMYITGNHTQSSNINDAFPTYQDKNGTFDFMGGFNVARVDGTYNTDLVAVNFSSIFVNLYFAVHF